MSVLARLLERAGVRAAEKNRLDPELLDASGDERERYVRDLLCDYAAKLRDEDERPLVSGTWIFARRVDHEQYVQAVVELLRAAEGAGRFALAQELASEDQPEDCACRCRQHRRVGCAACVTVESCPRHSEPVARREDRGR